jgi:Zn-dependent protease with chaperone function
VSAAKQHQQRRRSNQRHRGPRHVEPILDPTWRSAYAPSANEREANSNITLGVQLNLAIGAAVSIILALVLVLGVSVPLYLALLLPVLYVAAAGLFFQAIRGRATTADALAGSLVAHFPVGGTKTDRVRLSTIVERLSATFGLGSINCFVVEEDVPNATLLRDQDNYTLIVTTGLMHEVELIELEGVVAHCMARQRLGYIAIPSLLAAASLSKATRSRYETRIRGWAYRADEIAAATIRYPLGLQRALERTASTVPHSSSYFSSEAYAKARWIWFDQHVDGKELTPGDLDQASARAQALEEW